MVNIIQYKRSTKLIAENDAKANLKFLVHHKLDRFQTEVQLHGGAQGK
jgi:hypothetical protein